MAVHQPIHLSTDTPPSQASQLPQGYAYASTIRSALRPPRFAFDLRRPVKPRWPSSDIDLGGNPAGRRVSRAGPWMAHRGGPPKSMSDDGHTEPGRGAEWWGKSPFGYFWGSFPKVTRCKSGTNSRRYRSNGYVHKPRRLCSYLCPSQTSPPCEPYKLICPRSSSVSRALACSLNGPAPSTCTGLSGL